MKKALMIFAIAIITGCAGMPGMPGYITTTTSEFDKTKEMKMEPAWIKGGAIKFALFKNSKMPTDEIILEVVIAGTDSFGTGKSLHFNIDGEIIDFASIDSLTDYKVTEGFYMSGVYLPPQGWSSKRYLIDKVFLEKIINAQQVLVKVDLGKTYLEGNFSSDMPTMARPAFKDFMEALKSF